MLRRKIDPISRFTLIIAAIILVIAAIFINLDLDEEISKLAWFVTFLSLSMIFISGSILFIHYIFPIYQEMIEDKQAIKDGEACEKCKKHKVEYNSPGKWCFYCWTEWWVEGLEIDDPKERAKELKSVRRDLKCQN